MGVLASHPLRWDPERWWATSAGAKGTLDEALSFLWTKLFFRVPPKGSHEERWAVPRSRPAEK